MSKRKELRKDRIVYKTFQVTRGVYDSHDIDNTFLGGTVVNGQECYAAYRGGRVISNGAKQATYLLTVAYYV